MSRAYFGIDSGCKDYTTLTSASTEKEKKKETKEKEIKSRGACGQTSEEDCGLCLQDISKFIYRQSTTKKGHPINLMHQCRAICESTQMRCQRHVWEGDTFGWNNEYRQPLWCKQHAHMCAEPRVGHKSWYKNVCDKDGLKQPDLKFMDLWIESQTSRPRKGTPRKPYDYILDATTSDHAAKNVAENIEDEFWRKVYKKSSNESPYKSEIIEAYKDPKYLYLITKYFVFLMECAYRRNKNNHTCFSGEYDTQHDNYVRAIDVMIKVMKDHMPKVNSNLSTVRASLLADKHDIYTRYLREKEPSVNSIHEKRHEIIFRSKDWGTESVIATYRTIEDLKKLNSAAPFIYTQLYAAGIEHLEHDIEIPSISTENTIVSPGEKKKFIPTDMNEFEKSIRHILTTGSIPPKDYNKPYVYTLLLFMDFWNIGVVQSEAANIMYHMVETFPIKTTMEMLNLSQEQGNNFFLKKHTRPIIHEILNKRLEHIVEDYVQREKNSKNSKEKEYLNKTKEDFITMVRNIENYMDKLDSIPKDQFEYLAKLSGVSDIKENKLIISKFHNDRKLYKFKS